MHLMPFLRNPVTRVNPVKKDNPGVKTSPNRVKTAIFAPLTLGTLGTLNFRHLTCLRSNVPFHERGEKLLKLFASATPGKAPKF